MSWYVNDVENGIIQRFRRVEPEMFDSFTDRQVAISLTFETTSALLE
jgi:hypothetical protein